MRAGGDQAGNPRPNQRDPVGRAEAGMRMVAGEPALDGEQQTGEQQEAGSAQLTVPTHPPKHRNGRRGDGEPERARE